MREQLLLGLLFLFSQWLNLTLDQRLSNYVRHTADDFDCYHRST